MAQTSVARSRTEILVNDFVRSVYNWMAVGLCLTGVVALYVSSNETMMRLIFGNSLIFFVLILQFGHKLRKLRHTRRTHFHNYISTAIG